MWAGETVVQLDEKSVDATVGQLVDAMVDLLAEAWGILKVV